MFSFAVTFCKLAINGSLCRHEKRQFDDLGFYLLDKLAYTFFCVDVHHRINIYCIPGYKSESFGESYIVLCKYDFFV